MNEKKKKKGFYPGYSFGMKKPLVKAYAFKDEVLRAISLMDTISRAGRSDDCTMYPHDRDNIRVARAELRGFRKMWRIRHSDSFKAGVYRLVSSLNRYQISVPVGQCGTTYPKNIHSNSSADLKSGALLIWVEKDELGANEFMVSDTNFLIKVPRGHSINDKIQKVKEE